MKLIKPSVDYKTSYLSYIEELGDEERYPFPLDFEYQDFQAMLSKIADFEQGRNLPAGYVPSTTFWLVEYDDIIGVSNLRHHLNDQLLQAGGHIGLSTRPSLRGQGLGIKLLKMTLEQAALKSIHEVHVHCYANNPVSAKMIEACGGVLGSVTEDGGHDILRFLIDLK